MAVALRPLGKDNLAECFALEVTDSQRDQSRLWETPEIISAEIHPGITILTIYSEEIMVGLVTFAHLDGTMDYEIRYFLIDRRYQRCGYGMIALKQTIAML